MRLEFSKIVIALSLLATYSVTSSGMSDELSTQGDIDSRMELPTITGSNSSGADADLLREFGSLGFEKIRGIGPEQKPEIAVGTSKGSIMEKLWCFDWQRGVLGHRVIQFPAWWRRPGPAFGHLLTGLGHRWVG